MIRRLLEAREVQVNAVHRDLCYRFERCFEGLGGVGGPMLVISDDHPKGIALDPKGIDLDPKGLNTNNN